VQDGIELSIIRFDRESQKVCFAGARRPILRVRHGEITQWRGDKFPVGSTLYGGKTFTQMEEAFQTGDRYYAYSDGIVDQFDANNTRKFGSKKFKTTLLSIQEEPITQHGERLQAALEEWRGPVGQTDDILVMGWEVIGMR